jgi:hypothetical protein
MRRPVDASRRLIRIVLVGEREGLEDADLGRHLDVEDHERALVRGAPAEGRGAQARDGCGNQKRATRSPNLSSVRHGGQTTPAGHAIPS